MPHRPAISAILAAAALTPASLAAEQPPASIFRVSANGPSRDQALKDATQVISQRCAANGYVILNDQIKPTPDGVFYYGPVTARCTV